MPYDILDYHINRILVSECKIGYILGKRNKTRRLLQKKHNVNIYLFDKSEDGSDYQDLLGSKYVCVVISTRNLYKIDYISNNVINCKNEIEKMICKLDIENSNRYTGCDNCITKSICKKNTIINIYQTTCNVCNKVTQ